MSIRINVQDLPLRVEPQSNDSDEVIYQLTYKVGLKTEIYALPQGETHIGSSPKCDLCVKATGVRTRHLRIKRDGGKLYIQSLGEALTVFDETPIDSLTELLFQRPFTFGSVTAVVEKILPRDRQAAVKIKTVTLKSFQDEEEKPVPEIAVHELGMLNDTLEHFLQVQGTGSNEQLLEVLWTSFAPTAAAIYRRQDKSSWVLLGELKNKGAPSFPDPEKAKGYHKTLFKAGRNQFLLLILFPEEDVSPWQAEVCRQVLLLSCLRYQLNAREQRTAVRSRPGEGHAWQELVGSSVRGYLGTCTEMCHYSDTVLVLGETGTGKELVARSLHRLWQRKGEFIAINCAAIPGELLDAELFGVESGTATGVIGRTGRIEQARNGTLFLDEMSELPIHLQSKLLRVLQEREFFSIGGTKLQHADVKIVATSNRSEEFLSQGKHMRQDLYFRLSQAVISLPPLRQRPDDIAALSEYFLTQLEQQYARGVTGMSVSALQHLKQYPWPGNVREFQNILRYLYARTAPGSLIQSIHLPATIQSSKVQVTQRGSLASIVRDIETQVISQELQRQKTVRGVAKALGLSEGYLYRKIKKLGLDVHPVE